MQWCPQEYYDNLLCPLLGPLFAYMQQVWISSNTNLGYISLTHTFESYLKQLKNMSKIYLFVKWIMY